MRWLILGGTGALGTVMADAVLMRGATPVRAARSDAEAILDVADLTALETTLETWRPDGVINCAAVVDLNACEADPGTAYRVNARPLATLAAWARTKNAPLVHISTDQFFLEGDGDRPHAEDAPVTLVNEYARTKFAAEALALTAPQALVVRTNVVSATPGRGKTSLAAWAFDALETRAPMTLFDDYYCSTIDAPSLAEAVFDLVDGGARGLLNVASSSVASKMEFIQALAAARGIALDWADIGSAAGLEPKRATHIGLDVSRAEALLGRRLPDLDEVAAHLAAQRRTAA